MFGTVLPSLSVIVADSWGRRVVSVTTAGGGVRPATTSNGVSSASRPSTTAERTCQGGGAVPGATAPGFGTVTNALRRYRPGVTLVMENSPPSVGLIDRANEPVGVRPAE